MTILPVGLTSITPEKNREYHRTIHAHDLLSSADPELPVEVNSLEQHVDDHNTILEELPGGNGPWIEDEEGHIQEHNRVHAQINAGLSQQVAMFATVDEVSMWKVRSSEGPFRVTGDFADFSPGHWSEMLDAAARSPFDTARWDGPQTINDDSDPSNHPTGAVSRCGSGCGNVPGTAERGLAHDMMSAAYVALMDENTDMAAAITAEIKAQSQVQRNVGGSMVDILDWNDRTLYPYGYYGDLSPIFSYASWVREYVVAYDIAKRMGHGDTDVEAWFFGLADLCASDLHVGSAGLSSRFPDRRSDDPPGPVTTGSVYENRNSAVDSDTGQVHWRVDDGNDTPVEKANIIRWYNNRRSHRAGFAGMVGVLLDDAFLINEFKRYAREWVMFGHHIGNGAFGDYDRGENHFPQLGYHYMLYGTSAIVMAADALARIGDTYVYDFASDEGSAGALSTASPGKSFEDCIHSLIRWTNGDHTPAYVDGSQNPSAGVVGDPEHRIVPMNVKDNRILGTDGLLLHPATYFNRPDWVDAIMRIGTPTGWTANVQSQGSTTGWRSDWRSRFLRSIDVNPYPAA